MMKPIPISIAAICILVCSGGAFGAAGRADAQSTDAAMMMMPPGHMPQITVTATGSVDYVPDKARVTLGIRADSVSAASAVDTVNKNAAAVIAALRARGVPDSGIKTIGFNLFYREPMNPPAPMNAPVSVNVHAATAPAAGTYQASELLAVTVPVGIAGQVLDAAIGAGANESFGLSYETSSYDALYRQALAKAVKAARDSADALAKAAHVTITGIVSLSNSTEGPGPIAMRAAMPMAAGSVLPGTDAVVASVSVVYRIR